MPTVCKKPESNKPLTNYTCNPRHNEYSIKCENLLNKFEDELKVWEIRCHGKEPYPYTCWYVSFKHTSQEELRIILNFAIRQSNIDIEFRFLDYVPKDILTEWAWRIRDKWVYIRFNSYTVNRLEEIVKVYLESIRNDFDKNKLKCRIWRSRC